MSGPVCGLLLGKFYPPHRGHQYLVDFARAQVDHLIVHVCSTPADTIPGVTRFRWMQEQFGGDNVRVVHNDDPNPQYPDESPSEAEFYALWRESLLRHTPPGMASPQRVFASEPYGFPLAECLGAEYMPVDQARELIPISATRLRANLSGNWRYLIPSARPDLIRRVAVVGPESSGKSTLTPQLARAFGALHAPEYARGYLAANPAAWVDADTGVNRFDERNVWTILRGQEASLRALSRQSEAPVIFSDTDAVVTACWSDALLGRVPSGVEEFIRAESRFDLYLVTAATDTWIDDGSQRVHPDFAVRKRFEEDCIRRVAALGHPYVVLTGSVEERLRRGIDAVRDTLGLTPTA